MVKCARCLKEFPINSRLIRHIKSKKICNLHINGQDLNKVQLLTLANQTTRAATIHKCSKCGKICNSKSSLERHESLCNGVGCFMKEKLMLRADWRKYYNKPKNLLKAVFYCTYIDNPNLNKKLIKKIDGKYYKLYIDSKWTPRITKYTILNKFLIRIVETKSKCFTKKIKKWCQYWIDLYITNDKQLESIIENKNIQYTLNSAGGRAFYKFILDDIMIAVDGGIENVKLFNIFGMIPYDDYLEHLKKEMEDATELLEYDKKQEAEQKKRIYRSKMDKRIKEEIRSIEYNFFKQKVNLDVYKNLSDIINGTDMEDNDDIREMENSVQNIMEKYIISRKIQNDIYYYLERVHPGVSFRDIYKKLDF